MYFPCFPHQLSQRRSAVAETSSSRRSRLEDSLRLQQFERDASELKAWISEKMKIAQDESFRVRQGTWKTSLSLLMLSQNWVPYIPWAILFCFSWQDPSNLQSKVQKHQAFEAELDANHGRIESMNKTGQGLVGASHYASEQIRWVVTWLHGMTKTEERKPISSPWA